MKILIVDDNAEDRKLLRYNLEHHGSEVIEASDGAEGLHLASVNRPDLIVSDALMPVMDGFNFLRSLKKDETLRSIPFIFHSAVYTGYQEAELAVSLGAEAFIVKPKDPQDLWNELVGITAECKLKKEKVSTTRLLENDEEFLRKYSHVVATKLEEKVKELEESRSVIRQNLVTVELANVELKRINMLKDRFLGMVSHELRTPLSLICGYLGLLISDRQSTLSPASTEAVQGITDGAERMKAIVSEMLDIVEIEATGVRLTLALKNVGHLVEDVLNELAPFIKIRSQKVVLGNSGNTPLVALDWAMMRQVVKNLIGNAIKFTPDGGTIWIDFNWSEIPFENYPNAAEDYSDKDGYIKITVRDSGIGIDHKELDHIFDKFYEVAKVSSHFTGKYSFLGGGMGLGLSIARGIVLAHGGRLWAESPGLDPINYLGSSFHVVLPVKHDFSTSSVNEPIAAKALEKGYESPAIAAADPGRVEMPDKMTTTNRKKVLLIDDDQGILDITSIVLGKAYEVKTADNGGEGLTLARSEPFDLILIDVYMDGMDGYEVCALLKSDERTKNVPVAMFSAGVQKHEIEKGLKSGAVDYIAKPFNNQDLLAKVAQLTD